jgi:uncharacterized protein (TIGR00661 family)
LEIDAVVHILTSGDAYDFFKDSGHPRLHRVGGIRFVKTGSAIHWTASVAECFNFIAGGKRHLSKAISIWNSLKPNIAVTDFEPLVPRIALRKKVPVLAIDNQSKISHCHLRDLPAGLRMYQAIATPLMDQMVPQAVPRVVSCFHPEFCHPRKPILAVTGPMIRGSITRLQPSDGGFALVYYKEVVGQPLLLAAKALGLRTLVFGGMEHARNWPGFEFLPHGSGFAEALAACSILVCPAGNQLLGEARFFGKKTLCIPQKRQFEQAINAFYMEKIGLGMVINGPSLLENLPGKFRDAPAPAPNRLNEVERVAQMILGLSGVKH